MQFFQKSKPLFFYVFLNLVLLPATISLHEWGHWAIAYILNYKRGYVVFTPAGGMFILTEPLRNLLDGLLIGVSGGVTVTLVFALLFLCLDWETDLVEKNVLKSYCISQFTYGLTEGLYGVGILSFDALFIISNLVYTCCFYAYLILTFIYIHYGDC